MTSSDALKIDCEFKYHQTVFDRYYACVVSNLHTSFNNRTITAVNGKHLIGKSNEDVEMFFSKKENCPYLPLNLYKFFPNLEVFYVMNSNVQHLITGDIDGLDKLKIFDVSYNPVDQIGEDFFKGHENLEKISFYESHLKKVTRGAFDGLENLRGLYFDFNACIDDRTEHNFEEFIENLYDKCQGKDYKLKEKIICEEMTKEFEKEAVKMNSPSNTIYIILIILTLLLNLILGLILFRIFRRNYGGNWSEMRQGIL